jgi:hypothetical protein
LKIKQISQDASNNVQFIGNSPSYYGIQLRNYPGVPNPDTALTLYYYNILAEVTQPGDWYLDRENAKLYYYLPNSGLTSSDKLSLTLMSKPMIELDNTSYINFTRLKFSNSGSTAIRMKNCDHILVAGSDFKNFGQHAIDVGDVYATGDPYEHGYYGGHDNRIQSNNIDYIGQGGIFLGGGSKYTLTHGNNVVDNNKITNFSVYSATYTPAVRVDGCGNIVSRNYFAGTPHAALLFYGNDQTIEGNEITNACTNSADMGPVYSGRRISDRGNIIKNNYLHDTGGLAGIYLDDNFAAASIISNLFSNVAGYNIFMAGGQNHEAINNIFLNASTAVYSVYRKGGAFDQHFTAPGGTIYQEVTKLMNYLNTHPEEKARWTEKYPKFMNQDFSLNGSNPMAEAQKPYDDVVTWNVAQGGTGTFNTSAILPYRGIVSNNTTVAAGTSIGFTNPSKLDYSIKPGSIIVNNASSSGYAAFDASKVGLYPDEYRTAQVGTLALVSPANSLSLDPGAKLEFIWTSAQNASSVLFELSKTSDFSNVAISKQLSGNDTSTVLWGLDGGSTYYWRVTAIGGSLGGSRTQSEIFSFTTLGKPLEYVENFDSKNVVWGWDITGTPVISTEKAHSGINSMKIDTDRAFIQLTPPAGNNGILEFWMYDTNATTSYLQCMGMTNGTVGVAGIGVDTSKSGGATYYQYRYMGTYYSTGVQRSAGWHKFAVDCSSPSLIIFYIDDKEVARKTVTNNTITTVQIGDLWASNGVSNFYFDDLKLSLIQLSSVNVTADKTILNIGDTGTLTTTGMLSNDADADLTKGTIVYTSSDLDIVSVDNNGVITANKEGSADIIATVNLYGTIIQSNSISIVVDCTAPVTSAKVSEDGANDWYKSNVEVTLTSNDNLSGVDRTEYRIGDSGDWITYEGPIDMNQEGVFTLEYRSMDRAGNIEETKHQIIKIDKTMQNFTLIVNENKLNNGASFDDYLPITFKISDDLSGIASAKINIGGRDYIIDTKTQQSIEIDMAGKPGSYTAVVTLEDVAGNKLETSLNFNVTTSINSMMKLINRFIDSGELSGPIVPQLSNALNQAQHQLDIGHSDQSAKHIQDFVDRLNNKALSDCSSEKAIAVLNADAQYIK